MTAAVFESPPSVAGWEEVSETGQVRGDDVLEAGAKSNSLSRVREAPACGGVLIVTSQESGPGFRTHTVRPVPVPPGTHTVRPVPVPPGHGPGAQQGPRPGAQQGEETPRLGMLHNYYYLATGSHVAQGLPRCAFGYVCSVSSCS